MTRKEHLEFCKRCSNRKMDTKQGLVCELTNEIANFEESCPDYDEDKLVKIEDRSQEEIEQQELSFKLDNDTIAKLLDQQDFYFAIIGGLISALVGAVIWAVITVSTNYQIGYMAIGVGLLVGFSVRFFGAGIDKKFGILGGVLSLLGCVLGNLFSQVVLIAHQESFGYFETLSYLNFGIIIEIMAETFNPMDVLFYGIAVYEGYKFAFRKVTNELISQINSGSATGVSTMQKIKKPLAIASIVVLVFFVYKVKAGVSGDKTYYYESGKKLSQGALIKSKEDGEWKYYYEDGSIQSIGNYSKGVLEGDWSWYDEAGNIVRTGCYKDGLEEGVWMSFYSNGNPLDSGLFVSSRLSGYWKYWYETGEISQTGYYVRNMQDSIWHSYYPNGKLSAIAHMKEAKPVGNWTAYYESGRISLESSYDTINVHINNAWTSNGNQIVKDGNGVYKAYYEDDNIRLLETGTIKDGLRFGEWKQYFENGKLKEVNIHEGKFIKVIDKWDSAGKKVISDGLGSYIDYYEGTEKVYESGNIKEGLREGLWLIYYPDGVNISQEIYYKGGLVNGKANAYYETGELSSTGDMKDGKMEGEWTWYHSNGIKSSTVTLKAGNKQGKQELWSETGQLTKIETYQDGKLIEEETI